MVMMMMMMMMMMKQNSEGIKYQPATMITFMVLRYDHGKQNDCSDDHNGEKQRGRSHQN